ncbi:non-hydrolyzing UDP-N-acetylglucosamine 2-epimerase [Gloeobacter kilaueensis]|uniref:UDP-N-acetylglucosamine 2-epimerase (non-hydrolyzing) n=1 Tax=Gloeobacter kilaueensis (strain ATCC BAA-2537 / CCAP 1431/1 / ULC 316 / JS1) TaxID=1183438 RepID=U5QMA0_GLOK1|nr:UDP-N-acetylglucosamine 2-epimerase (non-hydrolyzing) [Gloeobacter kilaueensis]AGY60117.1 UDP-N-acetylglucosamine 2-epimerase [Gloeobacter kilaueensis JS1]
MSKVAIVLGTRPEAVKLAPVILRFRACPRIETRVILTGQHREMLHQTLAWFDIEADSDLQIMTPRQSLAQITCRALTGLEDVFQQERPELVIVQGDTTTTFAAALAAFYQKIPLGHVEAGLRTGVADDPFPEEMNRRLTSRLSALHFAPTTRALENLRREGIHERVYLTGNTVIDALQTIAHRQPECPVPGLDWQRYRVLLVTVHRRENWGRPLADIAQALVDILEAHADTAVLLPLHKNPTVREPLQQILGSHPRAFLTEPLDYPELVGAMQRATLVLTDSGGLQEEAPALAKPVLVLRETTERPEAIEAGVALQVGTDRRAIVQATGALLTDTELYKKMAQAVNPFGDGRASGRILEAILAYLGFDSQSSDT